LPIYLVTSYYVRPGKLTEYKKWLNSKENQQFADRFEKETGWKYLNTYWVDFGLGDYDCEDWYVAPNYAALDKADHSKALGEWTLKTHDLIDHTRSGKTRVMRTFREIVIIEPTKK
jgi:hypothetical protein